MAEAYILSGSDFGAASATQTFGRMQGSNETLNVSERVISGTQS
ncbi:MAG: hypothetical protein ABL984_17115 [Pyrinomonadaceae bacterium]